MQKYMNEKKSKNIIGHQDNTFSDSNHGEKYIYIYKYIYI
jgi:hypothetical protein